MVAKYSLSYKLGALSVALGILVSGCTTPVSTPSATPPPTTVPTTTPEPSEIPSTPEGSVKVAASGIQRETNPSVGSEDLATLTAGQNALAFDLYQAIRANEGNLFYSPYSISTALAMTYAGARGETAEQMAATLHYDLSQEALHPAFNALEQRLSEPTADETFTLTLANSVWAQEGYPFLDTYLDVLARNYGAGVRLVDFVDPQGRTAAREAINQWVEQATQGKIDELITEQMLTDLTRMVLANAIYFKADWEEPFRHGTEDAPFYLRSGEEVTAPMMSRRAGTPYTEGLNYQAVAIPYKGRTTRMVIILPAEGAYDDIEAQLDVDFAQSVMNDLSMSDVKLYLPKFSYDAKLTLKQILQGMGMTDAFDPAVANFSGMDGSDLLYISHVAHKAFVAVDEEGTEAAAATGVVVEEESMPIEVRANRPFIFFIHDADLELVLFVGRVINPVAAE